MKFALNNEAKEFFLRFSWSKGVYDFFNFIFCSYTQKSLPWSRSFPRGVARGGLHFFW